MAKKERLFNITTRHNGRSHRSLAFHVILSGVPFEDCYFDEENLAELVAARG